MSTNDKFYWFSVTMLAVAKTGTSYHEIIIGNPNKQLFTKSMRQAVREQAISENSLTEVAMINCSYMGYGTRKELNT